MKRTIGLGVAGRAALVCAGALAALFMSASSALADERPPLGVRVGQMYPDFLLPTLDGELGRLSDYRGKKILLFHFASW